MDQNIYDEFYSEMYDGVNNRDTICQQELFQIVKNTEPTALNSVFLDIGSGSGCVLNQLVNAGYKAYGIDKSLAMLDYSETVYPNINVKNADVMDPMSYEHGLFTHVLCLNFTIYEFENKRQFFSNCYYWVKPNSYLVVHLVDPLEFSSKKYLKSIGKLQFTLPENKVQARTTTTSVDFADCKYTESYEGLSDSENVIFKQTFTDNFKNNVRQNEQKLKMESIDNVLMLAKQCGFIVHAKVNMKDINGDQHQYLYVLERTM